MSIPVYVGKQIIGRIEGRTFIKRVEGSQHMLQRPVAWSIDCHAYDTQIKPACDAILIIDKETGKQYKASIALFERERGIVDRKFGKQYFLTLDFWNSEKRQAQLGLGL